jgi:hypothetical protein
LCSDLLLANKRLRVGTFGAGTKYAENPNGIPSLNKRQRSKNNREGTGKMSEKRRQAHWLAGKMLNSSGGVASGPEATPRVGPTNVQDELRSAANAVQAAVVAASAAMALQPRTAEAEAATAKAVEEMDRAVDAQADAFDRLCALGPAPYMDRRNKPPGRFATISGLAPVCNDSRPESKQR